VGGCPHLASIAVSLCLCVSFCPSVTLCKHSTRPPCFLRQHAFFSRIPE
jgi:hypothetical protein